MIIVTGGAGFIGSNIVKALNERGETDIIVVDDLSDGKKFSNLVDCEIADYLDMDDFLQRVQRRESFGDCKAVLHEGACSATTEWDGKYVMRVNYEYSKFLLEFCQTQKIPFLYASSAAVYGSSEVFKEERQYEKPLNVYGYSKFLFDQWVRKHEEHFTSQVAGFRYFNVYGPREDHKGSMASVAWHLNQQMLESGKCKLFQGSHGYKDGAQLRDFVFVEDLAKCKLWFLDHPDKNGIFNLGTGRAQSFNDVAHAVLKWHGKGELEYIPFPDHLKGAYQAFTQADLTLLREAGYDEKFIAVEEGIKRYLDWLN